METTIAVEVEIYEVNKDRSAYQPYRFRVQGSGPQLQIGYLQLMAQNSELRTYNPT